MQHYAMQNSLTEAVQSRTRIRLPAKLPAWAAPVGLSLIALILRLHGLGDKPFWLDEVTTLHRATTTLPNLITESLHSKHYPSYFLLLWLVAKFGASQWLLRLPSAIFGAVNAALVYAIGRDADGPVTGFAAGLFLALSPFDVAYGQEARSYTMVACFILVALWGLVRLARDPAIAVRPLRVFRLPAWPWIAYSAGTAAALNVLNVAVPWLIAANVAAIASAYRAGADRKSFLRNWAIAQAFILATWLPSFVAVYLFSHGSVMHGSGWAPPETLKTIWSIIAPVYLYRISAFITFDLLSTPVPMLAFVVAALALYGAWRLRDKPVVLAVVGCGAIVLPVSLLLISLATPVLIPRYFAWSAAPFFILAGAGLGRLATKRAAAGLAVFAAFALINLVPYYHAETKPRWDIAGEAIADEAQPGDVVLANDWNSYYVLTTLSGQSGVKDRHLALTFKPADAAKLYPGHDLWVVYGRTGQGAMPTPQEYANSLSQLGQPASEQDIGKYIVLWRFNTPDRIAAACGPTRNCLGQTPGIGQP